MPCPSPVIGYRLLNQFRDFLFYANLASLMFTNPTQNPSPVLVTSPQGSLPPPATTTDQANPAPNPIPSFPGGFFPGSGAGYNGAGGFHPGAFGFGGGYYPTSRFYPYSPFGSHQYRQYPKFPSSQSSIGLDNPFSLRPADMTSFMGGMGTGAAGAGAGAGGAPAGGAGAGAGGARSLLPSMPNMPAMPNMPSMNTPSPPTTNSRPAMTMPMNSQTSGGQTMSMGSQNPSSNSGGSSVSVSLSGLSNPPTGSLAPAPAPSPSPSIPSGGTQQPQPVMQIMTQPLRYAPNAPSSPLQIRSIPSMLRQFIRSARSPGEDEIAESTPKPTQTENLTEAPAPSEAGFPTSALPFKASRLMSVGEEPVDNQIGNELVPEAEEVNDLEEAWEPSPNLLPMPTPSPAPPKRQNPSQRPIYRKSEGPEEESKTGPVFLRGKTYWEPVLFVDNSLNPEPTQRELTAEYVLNVSYAALKKEALNAQALFLHPDQIPSRLFDISDVIVKGEPELTKIYGKVVRLRQEMETGLNPIYNYEVKPYSKLSLYRKVFKGPGVYYASVPQQQELATPPQGERDVTIKLQLKPLPVLTDLRVLQTFNQSANSVPSKNTVREAHGMTSDLNAGLGLKKPRANIWLEASWESEEAEQVLQPVTWIQLEEHREPMEDLDGYLEIPGPKGPQGAQRWLRLVRNPLSRKRITKVGLYRSEQGPEVDDPLRNGWEFRTQDLNGGRKSAHHLYLCWNMGES